MTLTTFSSSLKIEKDLGFSTKFEFAVYSEIQPIINNDKESKEITKSIFEKETEIVGWKTKNQFQEEFE